MTRGHLQTHVDASLRSDLSAQALLQLAQLVLLLEQGQGLVKTLRDLQEGADGSNHWTHTTSAKELEHELTHTR